MSTFSGISTAYSGLSAQRRALDVTGHNIANASTPGYARQRVDLAARPGSFGGIHTGSALPGNGVDVVGQERIVDRFVVAQQLQAQAGLARYGVLAETTGRLEDAFAEPGQHGMARQLADFWAAWDDVANDPTAAAPRVALQQRTLTLAETFNRHAVTIEAIADDLVDRAGAVVQEAGGMLQAVAALNQKIIEAQAAGAAANELQDERDALAKELAALVGADVRAREDGGLDVFVGGAQVVSGSRASGLQLDTSTPGTPVARVAGGPALQLSAGQLGGMLEAVSRLLPGYAAALDDLAAQLAATVNGQHALGQDLHGSAGGPFLEGSTAATISLAVGVHDPSRIAAAAAGAGRGDNSTALALGQAGTLPDGPDASYRSLIARLGVQGQSYTRDHDLAASLAERADRAWDEISGVSLDEEMANLVAYQHAYGASARFMTAMDQLLETIVSGLGLVGR